MDDSPVRNDFKLSSCWSTTMSLNYRRDCIEHKVNKLLQMVWNDTKIPQVVYHDAKLFLNSHTSHKQSMRCRGCSPFHVNGWTNEHFVDRSALLDYCMLETASQNALRSFTSNFKNCTVWSTVWLERIRRIGPSPSRMSSRLAGSYDLPTCPPTLHMQVTTVSCTAI